MKSHPAANLLGLFCPRWRSALVALPSGFLLAVVASGDSPASRLAFSSASTSEATASGEGSDDPRPSEASSLVVRFVSPDERVLDGVVRVETDEGVLVWEGEVRNVTRVESPSLPTGSYVVRVWIAGFARVSRAIRIPNEEVLVTLEPVARVSGRVLGPDGMPRPATVRIVGSGIWPARTVQADSAGAFVLEAVPPGIYEVEAVHGRMAAEPRRGLDVRAGSSAVVTLYLQEGWFVEGVVTDASNGRPIAGASISCAMNSLDVSPKIGLTDASGRFRLGPMVGTLSFLDVRAPGYVARVGLRCRADEACRISMARGAVVAGRVVDEEGSPVPDAAIEVAGTTMDRSVVSVRGVASSLRESLPPAPDLANLGVTPEVPPIPLAESPAWEATASLQASLRTDPRGRFRIEGLPSGRLEVLARAPDFQVGRTGYLDVAAGQVYEDVVIRLERGGRLEVTVLDQLGRPAEARVEARSERDSVPQIVETDARGRAVFEGLAGTALLIASAAGRPATEAVVDVVPRATVEVVMRLDQGRRFEVRVLDERGLPIEDAWVRIESIEPGTGSPRMGMTNVEGNAVFEAAPQGTVLLSVSHPRYVSTSVHLESAERAVVRLETPLRLSATVADAWTAEAVVGAEVTASCLDAAPCFHETRSSTGGRVVFPRVRSGRYRVEVRAAGHVTSRTEVVVRRRSRHDDTFHLGEVALEPAHTVEGDVVDRFGRTVEDAAVTLVADDPRDATSSRTDARGHFALAGIPTGRAALRVEHPSAGFVLVELNVRREREPAPVVVRLPGRWDDVASPRSRRPRRTTVALALAERDGEVVVDHPSSPTARRLGLVSGDVLRAVDGVRVRDIEHGRRLLEGSMLIPAVLRVERGGEDFVLRAPREHVAL